MSIEFVKNPWESKLLKLVNDSRTSIKITCPYIKHEVANKILSSKKKESLLLVISCLNPQSIYSRVCDIEAFSAILEMKGHLKSFQGLHAKTFIFDDNIAVVTSSNLTSRGLLNNYEYGVLIKSKEQVSEIVNDFNELYKSEAASDVNAEQLALIKNIVANAPKLERVRFQKLEEFSKSSTTPIYTGGEQSIIDSLGGWRQEVFKRLIRIHKTDFSLQDIYNFERELQSLFPDNNTVRDSTRRNLQELRDLGLLEFLGNGKYRKLWSEG